MSKDTYMPGLDGAFFVTDSLPHPQRYFWMMRLLVERCDDFSLKLSPYQRIIGLNWSKTRDAHKCHPP